MVSKQSHSRLNSDDLKCYGWKWGARDIAIPEISFLNKGKGKLSKKNYSLELNKNPKVSGEGGEGVKQLQQ